MDDAQFHVVEVVFKSSSCSSTSSSSVVSRGPSGKTGDCIDDKDWSKTNNDYGNHVTNNRCDVLGHFTFLPPKALFRFHVP